VAEVEAVEVEAVEGEAVEVGAVVAVELVAAFHRELVEPHHPPHIQNALTYQVTLLVEERPNLTVYLGRSVYREQVDLISVVAQLSVKTLSSLLLIV